MSVRAIAAVWAYRGGAEFAPGYRLVLLRLADVAHDDGSNAFLGVDTIAEDCGVNRRTVQRTLRWLEDHGQIAVQHEATNRRPTTYRLTIPGLRDDLAAPVDVGPLPGQGRQNAASVGAAQGRRRGGVGAAPTPPDPDPDPDPNTHTQGRARAESTSRHKTRVDDEYRAVLVAEFAGRASPEAIQEEIDAALGHKNAAKWNDQRLYVKRWLGRTEWGRHGGHQGNIRGDSGNGRGGGTQALFGARPDAGAHGAGAVRGGGPGRGAAGGVRNGFDSRGWRPAAGGADDELDALDGAIAGVAGTQPPAGDADAAG